METINEKLDANLKTIFHRFILLKKNIAIFIYSLISHFKIHLIINIYKGRCLKLKNVSKK